MQRLSLADLESGDPNAPSGNMERRFLCPFSPCLEKRRATHRSFVLNVQTGAYLCHRCKASGKLTDFWEERPLLSHREVARSNLKRKTALPAVQLSDTAEIDERLSQQCQALQELESSPGERYLRDRGLSLDVCHMAGVSYSPNWLGRPAVYFPLYDQNRSLVAGQGRYVDGVTTPKTRTLGDKRRGVFLAPSLDGFHPFSKAVPAIILTEAPIDALSLSLAGFPAVALCGTAIPEWMHRVTFSRHVLLAFDADEAGDQAAQGVATHLESFGARCERLSPPRYKDWNEYLCADGLENTIEMLALRFADL